MINALFYELTARWFPYDQCFVLSTNSTMVSLRPMLCYYELTAQWFLYDQCFVL